MILGVDPGKSGGVALVHEGGTLASGMRMPTLKHGKRDVVNTMAVQNWVTACCAEDVVDCAVIELVNAMPGQGVASMFNFGRHTGAIEGAALMMGMPVHWVTPAVWKKSFGLSRDKRASLDRARLEFGADPRWDVLANDGIAEAALIALWWLNRSNK